MYMVTAERIKGHKVGYSEVRWYFSRKYDAVEFYHKANNAYDNYDAKMYRFVEIVKLVDGMQETL